MVLCPEETLSGRKEWSGMRRKLHEGSYGTHLYQGRTAMGEDDRGGEDEGGKPACISGHPMQSEFCSDFCPLGGLGPTAYPLSLCCFFIYTRDDPGSSSQICSVNVKARDIKAPASSPSRCLIAGPPPPSSLDKVGEEGGEMDAYTARPQSRHLLALAFQVRKRSALYASHTDPLT